MGQIRISKWAKLQYRSGPIQSSEITFTEQDGKNAEVESINQICLEEGAGEFAAAHEPDILAGAFAELTDERSGRLVDEYQTITFAGRFGMGEDLGGH